jgi:peroxiredoxin
MQCRSHAGQLGRLYPEFQAKNYEILLILGTDLNKARQYVESLHLPFPVLADPTRSIYHQYGLEKLLLVQRTASIIIDCNGKIQYMKSTTSPMIWLKESQEVLNYVKTEALTCP